MATNDESVTMRAVETIAASLITLGHADDAEVSAVLLDVGLRHGLIGVGGLKNADHLKGAVLDMVAAWFEVVTDPTLAERKPL